jgi:putative tryptophan/tyrosine transport system substrate-binding protein
MLGWKAGRRGGRTDVHGRPRAPRALGAVLAAMAALAASPASAQPVPSVGLIQWASCDEPALTRSFGPFLQGLAELGLEPGATIRLECRSALTSYDGLRQAAADLVALPVDIIVASSQPAAEAAERATSAIPIVAVISGDPVGAGFAKSLAEPGGNLTGLTYYATELTAKRLELLQEMVPGLGVVGVLSNPEVGDLPFEADTLEAAQRLGLGLLVEAVSLPADLPAAVGRLRAAGAEAVFILPDLMFASEAGRLAALALEHRLPCMAWGGWFVHAGCLMAYSSDYATMVHRLAYFVDRIIDGAAPGALPIEQPSTLILSLNLETAASLGIEVPASLMVLAGEIIE